MSELTIVMYHYVRDLAASRFPKIKGLDIIKFKRQLDYLQQNYQPVNYNQVIEFLNNSPLPDDACWLTFDDGYSDHYRYVFPELKKRGLQGSFFPPVKCVVDREMLDVNKIHFILASVENEEILLEELRLLYREHGIQHHTGSSFDDLYKEFAQASRMDSAKVIFIKRLMQHALPLEWRCVLVDSLFTKYVTIDEIDFANDLYMAQGQLKEMVDEGMYVGSHGYSHLWLNFESYAIQKREIEKSLDFLRDIGAPTVDWVMCFPYGAYNSNTLKILNSTSCAVGLTTKAAIANLKTNKPLELPRLDTNDLPQ